MNQESEIVILQDSVIDGNTGEILVDKKPRKKFTKGWVMLFQDDFESIVDNKNISKASLRVLLKLMCKMKFGNKISIRQSELANELGLYPSDVSKAIKQLSNEGIIACETKVSNVKEYALTKHYAWKGSVESYQKAQRLN